MTTDTNHTLEQENKPSLKLLISFIAIAWILETIDQVILQGTLDKLGIRPRNTSGLIGIPLFPFLHGGFGHLISNTFPFLVLGYLMTKAEGNKFITTTLLIMLLNGLGTWLIGSSNSIHVGASGLIYGYFGFIVTKAIMEKKVSWILIGIVVAAYYGSMILGVIPQSGTPISWEGHLTGIIAGIYIAFKKSKNNKNNSSNIS